MELDARVVIVTGGSYGIGRAIVRRFAAAGDAVIIAARSADRGKSLEAEIRAAGDRALFLETDVRSEGSVRRLIDQALEEWGRIDVLCNNAGIERNARADAYTADDFRAIVETNLQGMFFCTKHAFPHLSIRRGAVVNVSSVQAIANEAHVSVYAATKAGILGLTRGMAVDFALAGVRVNAVCPGAIAHTGMMENALEQEQDPEAVASAVSQRIPMGRMGEPADIAGAVYFLASADASYITGASLVIDGGLLARLAT